mmetsp:Transcript_2573/g.5669  ORF Transcript_2573/g.5669 Transcript_2573/m.5669 type:complete len:208 (-) Transcript_2573:339-962(-)
MRLWLQLIVWLLLLQSTLLLLEHLVMRSSECSKKGTVRDILGAKFVHGDRSNGACINALTLHAADQLTSASHRVIVLMQPSGHTIDEGIVRDDTRRHSILNHAPQIAQCQRQPQLLLAAGCDQSVVRSDVRRYSAAPKPVEPPGCHICMIIAELHQSCYQPTHSSCVWWLLQTIHEVEEGSGNLRLSSFAKGTHHGVEDAIFHWTAW